MSEKDYLVVGTGKSGICAADLLLTLGKKVTIFDSNTELDPAAFRQIGRAHV